MARSLISAVLVALFAMTVLFGVNFAVMHISPDHYRRVTKEAVQSGSLAKVIRLPFAPDKAIYPTGGNDCLILGALVVPRGPLIQASISPRMPGWGDSPNLTSAPGYPPGGHCLTLAATMGTLARHSSPEALLPPTFYHRYIHGDVTIAALLLGFLSFATATTVMLAACYGMLGIVALLAILRLTADSASERIRATAFLIVAGTLSICYALPVFGQSFSFAPSDFSIFGFILFGYLQPLGRIPEHRFILAVSAFGSATAVFEFMTGGVPLGMATLIMLLALGEAPDGAMLQRRMIIGVAAFTAAIVACFCLKLFAVWVVWGTNPVSDFVQALSYRVGGSVGIAFPDSMLEKLNAYHIDLKWIDANVFTRALFAGVMLIYSSFLIAWGSHILGAAFVLLPTPLLLALAYSSYRNRRSPLLRKRLALAIAGIAPILWYLVFANHTILHSSYMVRPLALNIALGLVSIILGYYAVSTDNPAPQSMTAHPSQFGRR